jgi:hypothetical protein
MPTKVATMTMMMTKTAVLFQPMTRPMTIMLGSDRAGPANSSARAGPWFMPMRDRAWMMGISVRVAKYQKAPMSAAAKLADKLLSPTRAATYLAGMRAETKPTARTPPGEPAPEHQEDEEQNGPGNIKLALRNGQGKALLPLQALNALLGNDHLVFFLFAVPILGELKDHVMGALFQNHGLHLLAVLEVDGYVPGGHPGGEDEEKYQAGKEKPGLPQGP